MKAAQKHGRSSESACPGGRAERCGHYLPSAGGQAVPAYIQKNVSSTVGHRATVLTE
ncbi:MAG TPA: hypothetical protein VGF67_04280 [Ktedonobacteraceae bacterium]